MKKTTFVFLVFMLLIRSAFASTSNGKIDQSVTSSARSVVGLSAVGLSRRVLVQTSGVVITKGVVLGSCHVLTSPPSSALMVEYRNKDYPAVLHKMDVPDDACSFVSKSLPAAPVPVVNNVHVDAGQNVYIVGSTSTGLPVISHGMLSALRKSNGMAVEWLRTTVAHGAIGGAVFDAHGRLIGVDVLSVDKGSNENIALPLKEIAYLLKYGVSPDKSGRVHDQVIPEDLQAVDNINHGDYSESLALLRPLAQRGDAHAQNLVYDMYSSGYGVSKNNSKANYWLIKSAGQGNANAEFQLGADYIDGSDGVPRDGAKAVHWLSMAAQRSIVMAQLALGEMYIDGHGVPQDLTKGIQWIRKAAEQGAGLAQFTLGSAYLAGRGVTRDKVQGAKWLMLARNHGFKRAAGTLSKLEQDMSAAQIDKARRMAEEWSIQHIGK